MSEHKNNSEFKRREQQFKNITDAKNFMNGLVGRENDEEYPKTALDLAKSSVISI